jgi:polyphenol oxidase
MMPFADIITAGGEPWSTVAARKISGLRFGMSTVDGPDLSADPESSQHAELVASFAVECGLSGVAWARQVHGGEVVHAVGPGCVGEADAIWTDQSGLGVLGRSADCPIVLVAGLRSDGNPLWGMAHASWRSTVAEITTNLLVAMTQNGLIPSTCVAAIAPSAGPCCYEVGHEVRGVFEGSLGPHCGSFFRDKGLRPHLDLWAANVDALAQAGVAPERVTVDGRCSICCEGFHSYRRDGDRAGRMGVVVGLG